MNITAVRPTSHAGILVSDTGATLPLRGVAIAADIHPGVISVTTTTVFVNNEAFPLEVTYICALPAGFVPVAATCEIAGRTIVAELVARTTAVERYDTAVADGRTAAIAEQVGEELFSFRIGNIAADEVASISVTVVGVADVDDGQATLRLPLSVADRFQPASTASTQPSRRNHAGRDEPTADIIITAHKVTPTVVTHDASYTGTGTKIEATLAGVALLGDVVVRWPAHTGWTAQLSGRGRRRWLTVTGTAATPPERTPRDVVVLLDRSGSMGGWKMEGAKAITNAIIDRLNPADRICVLAFDTQLECVPGTSGFGPADSATRRQISSWLSGLTHRGGTELTRALVTASGLVADSAANATIVIVTDAEVGDEARCLGAVGMCDANIVTVGVGDRVNGGLINAIAATSGGWSTTVESPERLSEAVGDIANRSAGPAVKIDDVTVAGADDIIWSGPHPSLYAGHQSVLRAEVVGKPLSVTVTGPGFCETVKVTGSGSRFARQMWAGARVATMLRADSDDAAAVAVAVAGNVLCKLTAFVAVDSSGRQLDAAPAQVEVGHLAMTSSFCRSMTRSVGLFDDGMGRMQSLSVSNMSGGHIFAGAGGSSSAPHWETLAASGIDNANALNRSASALSALPANSSGSSATFQAVSPSPLTDHGGAPASGTFAGLCNEIASYAENRPDGDVRTRLLGSWAQAVADHLASDDAQAAKELARLIAEAVVGNDVASWDALRAWTRMRCAA